MGFTVKSFVDSSGCEMSVLVDQTNQPLFWPNVFVTMEYRSKSVKTATAVLRALGMAELWGRLRNINLSDRLSGSDFLSVTEVEDLARFLRLTRTAQDQELTVDKAVSTKRVARLEGVRKSTPQNAKHLFAGRVDAANRIRWVAKYLEFHRDRNIGMRASKPGQFSYSRNAESAINRLLRLAPRGGSFALNERLEGVDNHVIRLVDDALSPSKNSPNNPFKSSFLRERNYLIWRLLAETGMRRSELTHLKVEDIDYATRRVSIRESKTLPRTVPISGATAQLFHNFIMEHWSRLPAKQTSHGYLTIGEDGKPLEDGSINMIFDRIKGHIPGVPSSLTPHTLRRTWNDRYSAKIDTLPADQRPSVNEETQIRNRLMGWSDNSNMGARYAKRHIRKKADRIAEELANSLANTEESLDD